MKNKLITLVATSLVKVGVAYNGNVSPRGWYQPRKAKKEK